MTNELYSSYGENVSYNNLQGKNRKGYARSKISFVGSFDDFTINTLIENYDDVAKHLQVFPTVTIYERGYTLPGNMSGFYYPDRHHIEIIDAYYLISILAHEMRHGFQYIYYPDIYFASSYRNIREYLNSPIERDARKYSLDYCVAKGYHEEAAYIQENETKNELVVQNRTSATSLGIDEQYFINNPRSYQSIPRNYHNGNRPANYSNNRQWKKNHYTVQKSTHKKNHYTVYANNYEDDNSGEIIYENHETTYDGEGSLWDKVKTFGSVIMGIFFIVAIFTNGFSGGGSEKQVNSQNIPKGIEASQIDSYILPNSATTLLTDKDLKSLTQAELKLARNEIYARHGFKFGEKDLDTYFSQKSWYNPNPNFSDGLLSELEHKNVHKIMQFEG